MNIVGTVSTCIVSGFAIYRFSTGDLNGALLNTLIAIAVVSAMLLGRTQRFQKIAGIIFGSTISAGCLISALLVSSNGLLWALLVVLINAFTLDRRWALGLNAVIITTLYFSMHLFQSPLHHVSWTTVAVLITSFALLTMAQLRDQRQKLLQQANLDPLTGAGNRRLMRSHLKDVVADRRRGRGSGTLLVLDLDDFKQINDQHGHETGDRVLLELARGVAAMLRADDGLYRMGGEEFVLLLRDMDEATARTYLPALHKRVSGAILLPAGQVYFSAGAAVLREGEDWSAWLARADKALYAAKSQGKNRLSFFEEERT